MSERGLIIHDDDALTDQVAVTSMIERLAANPAVDVEKLSRLIDMQERVIKHQAEAAFNRAFSALQGALPTIVERKQTDKGRYAPLEDIIEAIRPVLVHYGFSLSHRTEWPDAERVRIVGLLTHKDGHCRTSDFVSKADTSGSKNAIQALGSTVTYGRRYTTNDLLGLVSREMDNDGQTARASAPPVAPNGFDDWLADLEAVAAEGTQRLQSTWKESKREYREHLTSTSMQAWEGLKRVAAKAGTK